MTPYSDLPAAVKELIPTPPEMAALADEVQRLSETLAPIKQYRPQFLVIDADGTSHYVILNRQDYKTGVYRGDYTQFSVVIYTQVGAVRKTSSFEFADRALALPLRADHGWPAVIEIMKRVTVAA